MHPPLSGSWLLPVIENLHFWLCVSTILQATKMVQLVLQQDAESVSLAALGAMIRRQGTGDFRSGLSLSHFSSDEVPAKAAS